LARFNFSSTAPTTKASVGINATEFFHAATMSAESSTGNREYKAGLHFRTSDRKCLSFLAERGFKRSKTSLIPVWVIWVNPSAPRSLWALGLKLDSRQIRAVKIIGSIPKH